MKIKNIILIAGVLLTLLLTLNTISYANTISYPNRYSNTSPHPNTSQQGGINPNDFKPGQIQTSEVGGAINLAEKIIGGITAVGTVVAVVTTLAMGIKYMIGSVEQRAEYKKDMVPILFGMMMLFGVSWIIKLIYDIMTGINV